MPQEQPPIAMHVEGNGPPLALLHGGMGSRTHWVRNLAALTPHFTVHAIDLPGCGDSADVDPATSDEGYVDLVTAQLRAIAGTGRLRVAGFSFGGVVSTLATVRLGETVERLALLAPGGFGAVAGRSLNLRKMPAQPAHGDEETEVLRHNLRVMMFARDETADSNAVAIQRENVRRARFDSRRFSLGTYLLAALAGIRCPIHLICGEDDNLAWPSVGERAAKIRAAAPQTRVDLIPNAGHWIQYEASDEVNRLLLDFMRPTL